MVSSSDIGVREGSLSNWVRARKAKHPAPRQTTASGVPHAVHANGQSRESQSKLLIHPNQRPLNERLAGMCTDTFGESRVEASAVRPQVREGVTLGQVLILLLGD